MTTVAEQFAEILGAAGIKHIYGIVGDSVYGLTDAIRKQGCIGGCTSATRKLQPLRPAPKRI